MCGITGIIAFTEEGKKFLAKAEHAASTLSSRGPDAKGTYAHGPVVLSHRRLKIIDTTDNAAQPMSDASGRYTIVFNGEIFNYKELKKELVSKGISFNSESDTEVLLQLYIREKEKCLQRLNGEFAFAVYDREEKNLFLARDRFGIKPLFYFSDKDKFIFASEMKALLAYGIQKKIDEVSLFTYLQLNYIPSPWSIFEGVMKFPSSGFTQLQTSNIKLQTYYSPVADPTKLSYEQATKSLRNLLNDSVEQRLVSDVPLGAFLSGGIDSTIITALAARHTKKLKSFSIGFRDEKLFDETKYARIAAKKLGTEHHVFELGNDDLFANLHSVLDYTDEPFADSSALAVHILSMHTRKHVTVALSGDGADELFGGYNKHAAELKARKAGLSARLVKAGTPLLKAIRGSRNSKLGNKARQLQKFGQGMKLSAAERYWAWAGYADETMAGKLVKDRYNNTVYTSRKSLFTGLINEDFNSVLNADLKLVLENDMLVKADRMSMANSLELRVPFLDHRIVDLASSLPSSWKIDGKQRKKILKDSCADLLPAEIMGRGKQGFEVPLLKWFRTELKSIITNDLLSKELIMQQDIFNYDEVTAIMKKVYSNNPGDSVARLWGLIVFQHWWKKYMHA